MTANVQVTDYPAAVTTVYYNLVKGYTPDDVFGNCKASIQYADDSIILEKASDWYLSVIRFSIV